MQKIGVDCRLAGARHAGIGRYIENLVKRLPDSRSSYNWVFFFSDQKQAEQVLGSLVDHPRVIIVLTPIKHYSLSEQTKLPAVFFHHKLDLLHVPHFNVPLLYRGKLVITIHDLLWHEYQGLDVTTLPPWLYYLKYVSYRLVVNRAIHQARKILVPAETIKATLSNIYHDISSKIVVTKEGVDAHLQFATAQTQTQFCPMPAMSKVLLYVGSLYPHKNLSVVVKALSQLPDYQLWIVGRPNIFQKRLQSDVKKLGLSAQVQFLGHLTDQQLHEAMRRATALVQPSLSEGFGLTGVEAMAMQIPLIASDIPIFQEIYKNGAMFFDPHSPTAFAAAAQKVASLSVAEKKQILSRAAAIAAEYSWDKMTAETVQVYAQALR